MDISARRTEEAMNKDIDEFFIKTGEWVLHEVHVTKESQNFGNVLESKSQRNTSNSVYDRNGTLYEDTSHMRFFYMSAMKRVDDIAPDRITELHW